MTHGLPEEGWRGASAAREDRLTGEQIRAAASFAHDEALPKDWADKVGHIAEDGVRAVDEFFETRRPLAGEAAEWGNPEPRTIEGQTKSLAKMAEEVVTWARTKGWEPDPDRTFGDECALLHSEVSEALEAYRSWGLGDATGRFIDQPDKPEGVGSEFADILIRLLHYSRHHGIDLEFEYERKMAYNQKRAWRHGGRNL